MKYKILYDFGSDGFRFEKGEFDSIDVAVKKAMLHHPQFLIVTIMDWQVISKEP